MKQAISTLLIISAFAGPLVMADEQTTLAIHETGGLGVGALIGGLIAGPPGIVLGAAGGAIYGNRQGEKENQLTAMERKLQDREVELAVVKNELSKTRSDYSSKMQNVALDNRKASLDELTQGISMSVFFRTNQSRIDPGLKPHLHRLVALIQDIPELSVSLDGYADQRGDESHNLQLSRDRAHAVEDELIRAGLPRERIKQQAHGESSVRAADGDIEGYVFDRRVDIELTVDTET
jgi:outer membrane protein OmpA-like peptidoglycan-associated protein